MLLVSVNIFVGTYKKTKIKKNRPGNGHKPKTSKYHGPEFEWTLNGKMCVWWKETKNIFVIDYYVTRSRNDI